MEFPKTVIKRGRSVVGSNTEKSKTYPMQESLNLDNIDKPKATLGMAKVVNKPKKPVNNENTTPPPVEKSDDILVEEKVEEKIMETPVKAYPAKFRYDVIVEKEAFYKNPAFERRKV